MTVEKLLTKLRAEHDRLGQAIKVLEPYVHTQKTAEKIIAHVKKRKKHWTQTKWGREALRRRMLKMRREGRISGGGRKAA